MAREQVSEGGTVGEALRFRVETGPDQLALTRGFAERRKIHNCKTRLAH